MKKFLLLTLLSSISIIAFANDPVKFGITGGANSSSTSIDDKNNFGFSAGVLLQMPIISNRLYLCPSVQYSERSYIFTFTYYLESEKYNYKFSYIDVPLLIKLKTKSFSNRNTKLFTSFGPTFSYALQMSNSGIKFPSDVFSEDSDENMNRITWAVGINLGIEFSKKYQVSVGYNYGLTNMSNSNFYNFPKSRSIMLTLAFLL